MNRNSTSLISLYKKLSKLRAALDEMWQGNGKVSNRQFATLLKQYRRAVRKAITGGGIQPAARACSVMAVTLLLSAKAEAQCNSFRDANAVNPITINYLPGGREPFFVDIDADGDLDCYVLDGVYNYNAPFLLKNIGTNKLPVYRSAPSESGFPLGDNALPYASTNAAFVDIDGDGDFDCFLAEAYSGNFNVYIKYFENQGTPTSPHFVENEARNPLSGTNGSYAIGFSFADIDGDGDIDAHIVGDYFAYDAINTGTPTNPVFGETRNFDNGIHWYDERAYLDWNGDGLLDYVDDGTYYKNIGPKNNPVYVTDAIGAPDVQGTRPHIFTDLNSDGKWEFFDNRRAFFTLAPVPVIDTQMVTYNGKKRLRFFIAPTGAACTYEAFRNGVPVANSNRPYFIAQVNGVYSFTVTDSCGTGVSVPYRVNYTASADADKTAGMIVNSLAVTSQAYPNPFTNYLTLQLPPDVYGATVQVLDLQGRQLLKSKVSSSRITIGSSLAKGVYILQLIQGNTVVYSQKVVKQ